MSLMILRFILVGAFSTMAALVGLALPNLPSAPDIARNTHQLAALTPPNQSDVRAYVERLGATDFFPAALSISEEVTQVAEAEVAGANAGISTSFENPAIRALVRREAEWRLYTTGEESLVEVFKPGEELYDGWLIVEITPRTLSLERGGERQTLNVFTPSEAE